MARFSTVFGCFLVIAVASFTEINAQILQNINGKDYYFEDTNIKLDWYSAEYHCHSRHQMKLIGFESWQEWKAVVNFLNSIDIYGNFWTSGVYIANSRAEWEWDAGTGASVDSSDTRWSAGTPWNTQGNWANERILYTGGQGNIWEWYSIDISLEHNIVCEEI